MEKADSAILDTQADSGAWHSAALNRVLLVAVVIALVPVALILTEVHPVPKSYKLATVVMYLLLLAGALPVNTSIRARCWLIVVLSYAVAILAMSMRGLVGFGRIGLAVYPFWVMILLGSRAGWSAAGASFGIYALFGVLCTTGVLRPWLIADDPHAPSTWINQGVWLAMGVVPALALLDRFRALQKRTLEAERYGVARLQEEIARRAETGRALEHELVERRKLENRISQLGEEERRRFGHEIHDGVCQQLAAALLNCAAVENQLGQGTMPQPAQVARLRQLLDKTLSDAYEISRGISPVGAHSTGLMVALAALAQRTRQTLDVDCEFSAQGGAEIDEDSIRLNLYRIAQEAVSNAVTHGEARHILIELRACDGNIVLKVQDDGCGLTSGQHPREGRGLHIMSYRAHTLGGKLEILPAAPHGTVVTCTVPLRQNPEDAGHEP